MLYVCMYRHTHTNTHAHIFMKLKSAPHVRNRTDPLTEMFCECVCVCCECVRVCVCARADPLTVRMEKISFSLKHFVIVPIFINN
jgi:hypothetical protein